MRRGNLDSLDSLTLDSLSRRPPFLGDGVTPHTELAPGGPTRYLDVLFVAAVDQVSRCVGYPGGQTHEALPETSFVCPPLVRCTVRARPPLRWSPRHWSARVRSMSLELAEDGELICGHRRCCQQEHVQGDRR